VKSEVREAKVRSLLAAALEHAHGTHTVDDVLEGVGKGELQIWIGDRSLAVTEILRFPRMRALNVFLGAGEIAELRACLPGLRAWARGAGCSRLMWSGRLDLVDGRRSGWEGLMPEFTPSHVTLFEELGA
jgi:hypothetical protein